MKLHSDSKNLQDAISATSDYLKIKKVFIEKDYWISLVLKKLSQNKYADMVVFKGGTSLSKAFKLIHRFSEDLDIALLNTGNLSGNQIKNILRSVEKEITQELTEIADPELTSKGSRYRKSLYKYPLHSEKVSGSGISDSLLVEINSFANPYPFVRKRVGCMIYDFLEQSQAYDQIKEFELEPFELNILDHRRTLLEKLISLIRFGFDNKPEESLKTRIRHFYDIFYLLNDKMCLDYLSSDQFKTDFNTLLDEDRRNFEEPLGWREKDLLSSPLLLDFDNMWSLLKNTYATELSILAYRDIPDNKDVYDAFSKLISFIR